MLLPRFLTFCVALYLSFASAALAFDTRAKAAYVVDLTTDTVLLEKNGDIPLPPASMSKLMTLNMLFEALRDGRVNLQTEFSVSARAKAMGGSTMFLNTGDRPTVEDLIQGIIVQSGNDACVTVAEGLGGTEDNFARMMNKRAPDIGMDNSTFANASGWPNPNHRMSMKDLGVLARRLIEEFPEYYGYFGQREYYYKGRAPDNRFNRNPLLRLNIGADGLKTGHTEAAGYGLVGSATQGTRRIVFVITGLTSERERAEEAERVVNWAFRQFSEKTVLKEGTQVVDAPVWMGNLDRVGLVAGADLSLLIPANAAQDIEAEVTFQTPIEAPIEKGDALAQLVIRVPELPQMSVPLYADQAVSRGGFLPRVKTAIRVIQREIASGDAGAE